MSLTRTTVLLAAMASSLACHPSTLQPPAIYAQFVLNDINGRTLPTYMVSSVSTPTIVSNTLTLYDDGTLKWTEHRVDANGVDGTYTSQNTYTLTGNEIKFAYHCPFGAMCAGPPRGTILGSRLALDIIGTGAIVYDYIAN